MSERLSIVDEANIKNVVSSSNVQIGDSVNLRPSVMALAVQKEFPIFREGELDFANFDIFRRPFPQFIDECPVRMNVTNEVPVIKVGSVNILGIAGSSTLHIGSTHNIDSKARVKHFRQFLYPLRESIVEYLNEQEE